MLIASTIMLTLMLFGLALKYRELVRDHSGTIVMSSHFIAKLQDDLAAQRLKYMALEQGRDEESDAYEQQFLTFRETIADNEFDILRLSDENEALKKTVAYHSAYCLLSLEDLVKAIE